MAEQQHCPRCNGLVSVDAPEGLCPECLYLQALSKEPAANGEQRSPSPVFIPPTPAELARHFPQLEILELVGQGGMGAVYKARQPKLDRLLALKILPPEVARDSTFAERFTREARSMAKLNHPNIITIFDFGEADGLFYFSMEFVDGKNVRELMQAGQLTPSLALQIVPQVCDALRYAHDEGVVHRDIKPENILLDKKGRVKIADFGLAKIVGLSPTYLTLTGTHEVMGTLYYMAPEQMKRSHSVDHRADLYSLGVVFYEMLTGELPVGRFAPPSHKARVDGRLDSIVLRALSREPEHRYQDAAELKKDVEGVKFGEPSPAAGGVGAAAGFASPGIFGGLAQGAEQMFRRMGEAFQPAEPGSAGPPRQIKPNWPSVRFTIPELNVWGAKAIGEIYRNDETLIIEFQRQRWGGLSWSTLKEVRIALREIMSISCQTESWPHNPHLPKWMRGWGGTTQIVIKTIDSSTLAELPLSKKHGRGRLVVNWEDREAAQQLVDSIVRASPPPQARPLWGGHDQRFPERTSDVLGIRMQLLGPGLGLFFSGIIGVLASSIWGILHIGKAFEGGFESVHPWMALWAFPVLALAVLQCIGAKQMLTLQSYMWGVMAAVLALLPSPGWVVGLPCGIWAVLVLSKPEVMAAFLGRRGIARVASHDNPQPPPTPGRVRAFLHSIGRYCLTRFSGRQPPANVVEQPVTVDYPNKPDNPDKNVS